MAVGMFVEHGYAATSIEKLAALAHVGKQTIYRRYPTKEDLFNAAMGALRDRFLHAALLPLHSLAEPLAAIREACLAVMEMASAPETVGMYRVLIAEAQRFPQLVDQVMLHTADPLYHNVQARLQAAINAGQVRQSVDPETLARILVGMVSGWVLNQWLVGRERLKTREERLTFLDAAWTVFLNGVGTSDRS
ncbi:MAG: TetR/AcrR family transcriptional regulator [Magnetospirillum sp.]|nr:TetR/AcrR family transcriptional regulator [Magnetospirillum sp.]